MALDTFANLKTALATWLRRDDLTASIPDFITLAEAQINRRLKDAKVTARATATISDEYSAVPSRFGGVVSFDLATSPKTPLRQYSPPELNGLVATIYQTTGKPLAFAVVGSEFRFAPSPGESYTAELTYYQGVAALSDSATTNWLLTDHPDAYLYGALVQSAPFLRADERLGVWGTLFTTALDDIITNAERAKFGARPLARFRSFG